MTLRERLSRWRPSKLEPALAPAVTVASTAQRTSVDEYWSSHTVNSRPFKSAEESLAYLEWRFDEYPLFREFMGLWGDHDGDVILDFGCGPGNDVTGFLTHTSARVIGIDVSPKALALARDRVALHGIDPARVELIQTSDGDTSVPLDSSTVDYINCGGVLHHTSEPEVLLTEFRRVLRDSGEARIMVYNRDSLWFHLYTAYARMIVEGAFAGSNVDEAFSRNTDGEECPIARAYVPGDFIALAEAAGFDAEFVGGYFARIELDLHRTLLSEALADPRLGDEQRIFLTALRPSPAGYPSLRGKEAGVGGSYVLRPRSRS